MRRGDFELVTLRNGARAVRHLGHGEVMHPSVGPWLEANRLYVEQPRLAERLRASSRPLVVWDVGLGAATNAAAVIACAKATQAAAVELHSFERDLAPLELARADTEGFSHLVPLRDELNALASEARRAQSAHLDWRLHLGDAMSSYDAAATPDLILYDPFSPEANPALWTAEAFAALRAVSTRDAIAITYSASTRVRAAMLLGGFYVGQGWSIGTKSETTVAATRRELLELPLGDRWLDRVGRSTAVPSDWAERVRCSAQFVRDPRGG